MRPSQKNQQKSFEKENTGDITLKGKVILAAALSKLGVCSRRKAQLLIQDGKISVNGTPQQDPTFRVDLKVDIINVDGKPIEASKKIYLMLNKPKDLVTTTSDELGRETVYNCLRDLHIPCLFAVGRLDKESEGLLLFTTDLEWASKISSPNAHVDKIYHVKVDCIPDMRLLQQMQAGVKIKNQDLLKFKKAQLLSQGTSNSWLEIVLDEGKNRQIHRVLNGLGVNVVRLIRIGIGPLKLGDLKKGAYRFLSDEEIALFRT